MIRPASRPSRLALLAALLLPAACDGPTGTSTRLVQKFLDWNEQSRGSAVLRYLCGILVLLGGLGWTMRLPYVPVVSRAFFVGATAEVGNAWLTRSDLRNAELRTGMSLYVGADTGVGPLYFGLTHAPRGGTGIVMFLGRP